MSAEEATLILPLQTRLYAVMYEKMYVVLLNDLSRTVNPDAQRIHSLITMDALTPANYDGIFNSIDN